MEDYNNILECETKEEFYDWLKENHDKEDECFLECKKGKIKQNKDVLYYIDAVYMALCFGWIDSTQRLINGKRYQRFSPRKKNGHWSELNKARCKWLINNKLMTQSGLDVLPDLDEELEIDKDILKSLKNNKETWENFNNFPELYRRVRIGNIQREKKKSEAYNKALKHFLEKTKENEMYGDWDDNGRLTDIYD
jgi:uncharacterized protein YdeI (YjbR/CyaY-like superfamily)